MISILRWVGGWVHWWLRSEWVVKWRRVGCLIGSFGIHAKKFVRHEFSVVCRNVYRRCWHCCCCLWTVLLATFLINETYILHKCAYMPLVCAHEIFRQYDNMYLKTDSHFSCLLFLPLLPFCFILELSYLF